MPSVAIVIVWLILFAATLLAVSFGMKFLERDRKKKVTDLFQAVSNQSALPETTILNAPGRGQGGFLQSSSMLAGWEKAIAQAGLDWSAGKLLAMMVVGAVVGLLLGMFIRIPVFQQFAMAAFCLCFGFAPFAYVRFMRSKRLAEFEAQFPEGLDFLARSMRAGHAFSVSLEMLAEEAPEPLCLEFRRVFHEQNLGAAVEDALVALADRVPLLDVRFFVSAVLMQRDTGGNLAEILTKLAYVIRERFRLKGQVRAASAHGRITALILTVMPVATMIALMFVAPEYLAIMARDPDGKYMIIGAILGQVVGYFIMRRIIDIKV